MKLIQNDFNEQALVMLPRTKYLILEAIENMLHSRYGSVEMRNEAMAMQEFLKNTDNQDVPAMFQKSRSLSKCQDCAGSGQQKIIPDDLKEDVQFSPCLICQGSGQLYIEVIRKGYVPTEVHRRKFAR